MSDTLPPPPPAPVRRHVIVARWLALRARLVLRHTLTYASAWRRELTILSLLLLVLLAPFALKPRDAVQPAKADRKLVIVTPHHQRIRDEFTQAFTRHWLAKTGQRVYIDWRVPGGTSEIVRMLKSEYSAAFEFHWTRSLGRDWSPLAARSVLDPAAAADNPARSAFLRSTVGIGIDLFFGGGSYDFQVMADAGILVAESGKGTGLAAIHQQHPEWFADEVIPKTQGGEVFRDAQDRWCGTCLSSFGIVFNRDVLRRLGVENDPQHWRDLADPRLSGQVALADPGRSASVTKAFEMMIQQEMQRSLDALQKAPGRRTPEQVYTDGLRAGWIQGLRLVQRISANTRYFSDTATKVPLDVARGDAAAGLCIDFYGRTVQEETRRPDGSNRVGFVMPAGGTSLSVDPIGMLRGAPDPELATAFMEFVLSQEGQRIWCFRPGTSGGPGSHALRRLPLRKDLYSPDNLPLMPDGAEMPYDRASGFVYHPEWTGQAFAALRFVLRIICVENHVEQRQAWTALVAAGFPERATEIFGDLNAVHYDIALDAITRAVNSRDKIAETRLARTMGDAIRRNYQLAARLAARGDGAILGSR